jgi:acetoin utilization protein AcuC
MLRQLGAKRIVEPPMATDEQLARLHDPGYVHMVRAFSVDPGQPPAMGIGPGDTPPFPGMHEASALIAGGSIDAVRRIVEGDALHAFNPGGGLHHAMAMQGSGFCVYNDVALGVAAARDAGHRVLYLDLDVHHGDGTQALFWNDPGVLTFSIHETGRALFPGTGWVDEVGGPGAQGTSVNVPLEPYSGNASWLGALTSAVPVLADSFRPTFLVTQHGCDNHALDPLAHLRVTTAAYAEAIALAHEIAHRHCEGRWLATGGGGYDAYRVVPRSWGMVWLAQAHRELPGETPPEWRERWSVESVQFDQGPPPAEMVDPAAMTPDEPDELTRVNLRTTDRSVKQALDLLAGG